MRRYFVNPLNATFGFLKPNFWTGLQFDTLPAAQACQKLHPTWIIIDIWATLESPYLITIE